MSNTTHVIFDLGQTLTDYWPAIREVLEDYASSIGKQCPGYPAETESIPDLFKHFLKTMGDDSYKYPDKFERFCKQFLARLADVECQMMPGAHKLVKHLHDHNIPMAVATNGKLEDSKRALKNTIGLDPDLFSHIICGGDDPEVKNNKPAPDVYLICAKRFNPEPKLLESCVVFEDSIRGITGAVVTGMKTVLINNTPVHELGAIADKITVIVDSLENFRPESVGLPPY